MEKYRLNTGLGWRYVVRSGYQSTQKVGFSAGIDIFSKMLGIGFQTSITADYRRIEAKIAYALQAQLDNRALVSCAGMTFEPLR